MVSVAAFARSAPMMLLGPFTGLVADRMHRGRVLVSTQALTSIPDWELYPAFAMFRLVAIAQGIMGRVIEGTANDPNARSRGERARPFAEAG
jgi:aminoglycoside phosphotransferase (APT) family kinase protein